MSTKQYAVIGMGRFGSSVAQSLSTMGCDVLAIDIDEQKTQHISEYVTHAVAADATDEIALKELGISNFDTVVVAIGNNIQASILTTLILKERGVAYLIVKAQNELHGKVLQKIGANKIIYPERDIAFRVARQIVSPNVIDYMELSDDYTILEMKASDAMVGKSLLELNIRAQFHCNVIAIRRGQAINLSPYAKNGLTKEDVLVIVGHKDDLEQLEQMYTNE